MSGEEKYEQLRQVCLSYMNEVANLEAKLEASERKYEGRKQFCISEIRSQMKIINNLLEENNQLEQQLAEYEKFKKENNINNLKELQYNIDMCGAYHKDCEELERQLAEKEKELKRIKKNWELSKGQQRRLYDSLKSRCKNTLEQIDQDKISFAVEQLEKAKGKIQHNIVFVSCDDYLDVIEEINNQIKQLKEGK